MYTIPTSRRNAKKPASKLLFSKPTSASVPGALSRPLVMNSACWEKWRRNVALPIPLKKEI